MVCVSNYTLDRERRNINCLAVPCLVCLLGFVGRKKYHLEGFMFWLSFPELIISKVHLWARYDIGLISGVLLESDFTIEAAGIFYKLKFLREGGGI